MVTAVDQVRASNINYIPLKRGFLYLVAIVDLFSRHVLSWRISNSLDTEFCLDALETVLEGGRHPEAFHSDQGCQFTSSDFAGRPQAEEIKIRWSDRKHCDNNILVERLWRTVKDEEKYLQAYSDGWEAEISLVRFLWRYFHVRPHSSLGGRTSHEVYIETEPYSSRPGLTISGGGTCPVKGIHLNLGSDSDADALAATALNPGHTSTECQPGNHHLAEHHQLPQPGRSQTHYRQDASRQKPEERPTTLQPTC